jgi:hypothetical protein
MPDDDSMLSQGTVDFRNEARRRDDSGQLFHTPPKLSERQAYVYAVTADRQLNALTAGIELHRRQRCPYCRPDLPCRYAEANGREVLVALWRKGLLRRDRHHVYRRAEAPSGGYDPATAEWPEGF